MGKHACFSKQSSNIWWTWTMHGSWPWDTTSCGHVDMDARQSRRNAWKEPCFCRDSGEFIARLERYTVWSIQQFKMCSFHHTTYHDVSMATTGMKNSAFVSKVIVATLWTRVIVARMCPKISVTVWWKMQQADVDRPIRCYLLMINCKEHLKPEKLHLSFCITSFSSSVILRDMISRLRITYLHIWTH
jgi:hypothetical protein